MIRLLLPLVLAQASCAAAVTEPWPLWDAFAGSFVDAQGRVIDRDANDRTTSEGQAYSLFFALVAGDRERFDRILEWTVDNLAQGDLTKQLPAWLWGANANKGAWGVADPNSASDADLWMAYTLIEAGRLWGSKPLHELGMAVGRRIEAEEIGQLDKFGPMMVPGKTGFRRADGARLNSSYLPPHALMRLAHEMPEAHWAAVLQGVPEVWRGGMISGFVTDWTDWQVSKGFSANLTPGNGEPKASYDAIRVYLWAGMLPPRFPDRERFFDPLAGMVRHLRTQEAPPEEITAAGIKGPGGIGFSAAVIPLLTAMGEVGSLSAQKKRVQQAFDSQSRLYGRPPRYYDQCLVLFSSGWSENRFRFDENGQLIVRWGKTP
jgi:endo-1,4-beta-D-glucanase Y